MTGLKRAWAGVLFLLFPVAGQPLLAKLGAKAGLVWARNSGVEHVGWFSDLESRYGYHVGMVYTRDIFAHGTLKGEALYALKGDELGVEHWHWGWSEKDSDLLSYEIPMSYHYFEVPLLFEFYLSPRNRGFHLLTGAYGACLLKARMGDIAKDISGIVQVGDMAAVKKFDAGLIYGFGFKGKKSRRWRSNWQFRVERGLVDIARAGFFRSQYGSGSSRNLAISISLGLIKGG